MNLQGQTKEVLSRQLALGDVHAVSLSTRQDDFVVVHVASSYDSLLQVRIIFNCFCGKGF